MDEDQPSWPKVLVNYSYYLSWLESTDGLVRFRAVTKSILVMTPMSSSDWSLKSSQLLL